MEAGDDITKVRSWLAGTGFPLEYAAARTLERVGFEVDTGRLYRAEDGTTREVDLVGRPPPSPGDPTDLWLVVECKYARTAWVVLTRESKVGAVDLLAWTVATDLARDVLVSRARRAKGGIPRWLLNTPPRHGSAIVAMPHGKGDAADRNPPHDALLQVGSAARGLVAEAPGPSAVAWPLIVVRGPLYQAVLQEDGSLEPEPIHWQRVIWGGVTGQPLVIDVTREAYLETYARGALEGLRATERAIRAGPEVGDD